MRYAQVKFRSTEYTLLTCMLSLHLIRVVFSSQCMPHTHARSLREVRDKVMQLCEVPTHYLPCLLWLWAPSCRTQEASVWQLESSWFSAGRRCSSGQRLLHKSHPRGRLVRVGEGPTRPLSKTLKSSSYVYIIIYIYIYSYIYIYIYI